MKYEPLTIKLDTVREEVHLDKYCWSCRTFFGRNTKTISMKDENGECDICNGSGFVLTNNGEAIINLIKRHKEE